MRAGHNALEAIGMNCWGRETGFLYIESLCFLNARQFCMKCMSSHETYVLLVQLLS